MKFEDLKKDDIIEITHPNSENEKPQSWFIAVEYKNQVQPAHWRMELVKGTPSHYWSSAFDLIDNPTEEKREIIGTRYDYPEHFL